MSESSGHPESLLSEHLRQTRRHVRSVIFKIWGGGFTKNLNFHFSGEFFLYKRDGLINDVPVIHIRIQK